jgi:hypothetical protein
VKLAQGAWHTVTGGVDKGLHAIGNGICPASEYVTEAKSADKSFHQHIFVQSGKALGAGGVAYLVFGHFGLGDTKLGFYGHAAGLMMAAAGAQGLWDGHKAENISLSDLKQPWNLATGFVTGKLGGLVGSVQTRFCDEKRLHAGERAAIMKNRTPLGIRGGIELVGGAVGYHLLSNAMARTVDPGTMKAMGLGKMACLAAIGAGVGSLVEGFYSTQKYASKHY